MKKYLLFVRQAARVAIACALLQYGGSVWAAAQADPTNTTNALWPLAAPRAASAQQTGTGAQPADPGAQGDVAELTRLIQGGALHELRTTYNGNYGASLFFYPQDMTYYAALFQDKRFWRVIRLQDEARAEQIYTSFARQTEQLADVDIRRTKLQAQKAYIERMIGMSEDRAKRLQADLDVAHDQQAKVADYQREARGDALALSDEKEKARSQLRQLQQQVQQLQQQTEAGLPASR